jgi:TnpA family transposase
MKRLWSTDELAARWTLSADDLRLTVDHGEQAKLGLMCQLAFWREHARFPEVEADIAPAVVVHLAGQIGVSAEVLEGYDFAGRSGRRHRRMVVAHLAVREFGDEEEAVFRAWLLADCLPAEPAPLALEEAVASWFAHERILRSGGYRLDRLVRSARAAHDDAILAMIAGRLDDPARERLDALLADDGTGTPYTRLSADPGKVGLDSLLAEIDKLALVRETGLPRDLLSGLHPDAAKRLRRRAAVESAWELRRHPTRIRLPLLAAWVLPREAEIVDGLVELLIAITHRITVRAERKVVAELIEEARTVRGKTGILFKVASAVTEAPDGVVREVIFPVVDERTFHALVKEALAAGTTPARRVHTAVRASYGSYYRRMMPKLLAALDFRSNNGAHRPLIEALERVRAAEGEGRQYFSCDEVPIEGVVRPKWRDIIIEEAPDGGTRINRINYEICILQTLREKLRCKEVWVDGAHRFRNPDDDLPADFAGRRAGCYERLGLPTDAQAFTAGVKAEMTEALAELNRTMPRNSQVRLKPWRRHPISITPLEPQPEPPSLEAVRAELGRRWPMTGLLDILKEADLRIRFTDAFSTAASREATNKEEVRRRLLLCLYGLGTNAGLKRLAVGDHGFSHKELLHTRRRYVDTDSLRDATRRVVNATLAVRDPALWGEGTTACAADSTHFGALDLNLMTEWHARYGGRGVMIYWHVDTGSVCIHSSLKRCSSSEVASMIEGVLRHDTDAEIDRTYVDSHGQSEVAFAFCKLLGFQLLPRLKNIAAQRLYLPEAGVAGAYANLSCILTRSIDWELIEQQYDEMVRYGTALIERTADPETIMRRFTRSNVQHPTYRALAELGKAMKTVFLCRYLRDERLRREIHEGLNVVETWNSANGFIFFGRGGEVAGSRVADQHTSVAALHLLQSCLVYVNTLMLQRVLAEPAWRARMTEADMRGLTPLVWGHISPYGTFDLDMEHRLDLEIRQAA